MGPFAGFRTHHVVRTGGSTFGNGRSKIWVLKRIAAAAALWFYAIWYIGSTVAAVVGAPDLVGPVLGLAAGLVVGLDPRDLIWNCASLIIASAA